jgi:hypothetical protein
MPYFRCAECDLTVYAGLGYSTKPVCPDCGADLAVATRVYVGDPVHADLRPHEPRRTPGEETSDAA